MRIFARWLWIMSLIFLLTSGLMQLGFALLPFSSLRSAADAISKDGSMVSFTPALYTGLRPVALVGAFMFILVSVGIGLWREKAVDWIDWALGYGGNLVRQTWADLGQWIRDIIVIRFSRLDIGVLLITLGFGLYNRLVLLPAPMQYDEAYTFMAFARRSFWNVISDYELPNNHILHTLLVRVSFLLLGDSPEAIRLPALIAGLMVIPLIFLVARKHFNRETGWMAAGLAAFLPLLTTYSANARGYSLLMAFTLMLLAIAFYLLEKRNLAAWLALILISALGFFTVPVMVYPFGVVMAWLGLSAWAGRASLVYRGRQFLKYYLLAGIGTMLLTGILYLPVIYRSGWRSLFANGFIQSYTWSDFLAHLPNWSENLWQAWIYNVPLPLVWGMVAGLVVSLVLHKTVSAHRVPVAGVMLAWVAALIALQRPELLSKIFLALIPILLVASASGWFALIRLLPKIRKINLSPVVALVILLICMVEIDRLAHPNLPYLTSDVRGDIEDTVVYIKANYQPDEIVISAFPNDPQVWYYSLRHGLPLELVIGIRQRPYSRAWVVVKEGESQSLSGVIQDARLTGIQPDLQKAELATTIQSVHLYILPAQ